MLSGHRSAWRRRGGSSRAARIAVPLAIPMALGLTLGIILAVSGGGKATPIEQSAMGACASAAASASAAAPAASGSPATPAASASAAAPCPSASGAPAPLAAAVAGIPPINPAGRPGLAGSNAVDAAGNAFSFTQTPAEAANSTNCTVTVPAHPLSALALVGRGARQGNCIDAFGNSLINQTPQCNAANFYRMANFEIARGLLKIPAAGTGKDGQACQTTRDFALIDQDQSDNAVASYLFNPATGQTAQATAANQANLTQDTTESNGSDNGLLDKFVDPALGCTPFTAPNPTNPNGASASQALNELSARQNQKGTVALLPVNNPQLLVGGQFSLGKTDTYRIETDQPLLRFNTNTARNAARYCQDMINIATPRLQLDAPMETGTASPVPALGNNLANFLAARLSGSFDNLNCKNYGLTNPVTLTLDANGVATGAAFNTTPQKAKVAGGGNGRGRGAGHHNWWADFMPGRDGHE